MKYFLVLPAVLALAACNPGVLGPILSPSAIADRTKIDEQAGITVTLAYTAAARAATLAIRTGMVKDRATIARIGELDTRAFRAVDAVRAAYNAGNSSAYVDALTQANAAIGELLASFKGN